MGFEGICEASLRHVVTLAKDYMMSELRKGGMWMPEEIWESKLEGFSKKLEEKATKGQSLCTTHLSTDSFVTCKPWIQPSRCPSNLPSFTFESYNTHNPFPVVANTD